MENNKEVEQPSAETTKKKSCAFRVVKTVLVLAAVAGIGAWLGKRGIKGVGNDVKAGFNKVTGAVKNAMPKKSEQANVEVREPQPRNEYRGNHYHGNNKNYNN